ncbi:efflux RND transporter permease subunit [candidate division CSSED10-310 bacterium]|uniref:Efflux RND transporter permease subunit n=1 Tax=candidate division CSSED10-310 bacterium TaxID=2855610 RepID=A0ABV6YZ29_UNCC1
MNAIRFAVQRPIAATMFLLMAVFLGYYFYLKVPATLLPEFDIKFLFIRAQYPGASSEDMARLVTEPLEGFLELIHGLREMRSTTVEGDVRFNLRFRDTVDIELARIEAFEKIEAANLPAGIETFVFQFDPTAIPIIALDCFGGTDLKSVLTFAKDDLKQGIERIPGVGKVELRGERDLEIRISIPESELLRYGFSLNNIWQTILSENISPVGGHLREGRQELLVRTVGRMTTPEDFRLLPLVRPDGPPVLLGKIAHISETFSPPSQLYRFNGQAAVMLEVSRKPSANTLELCREVKSAIEHAQKEEKTGIKTDIYMDASDMIEKVLSGIKFDLFIGLIVAAAILMIFLTNIRSSFIILTTVPVCILATFVPMYFMGINLNLLSLMGFALVSGMLIDNAIIILENVFRFLRKGQSALQAAESGPIEVRGAVAASTFTSMAVFVPIFFIGGQATQLFRDLAFTAIFALGSSLVVAFVLVPLMASKFLSGSAQGTVENRVVNAIVSKSGLNNLGSFCLTIFLRISQWSESRWWKRLLLIALVVAGLIAGMALKPPQDTAQMDNPNQFVIRVETGGGTSILRSDGIIRNIEDYLRKKFRRVEDLSAWSNKGGGGLFVELWDEREFQKRFPDQPFLKIEEIQEQLIRDYRWMPNLTLRIDRSNAANPQEESFQVKIIGRHFQELRLLAEKTKKAILALDDVYQVETDFDLPGEEVRVLIDHNRASDLGISPQDVSGAVRQNLSGGVAFAIPREGEKLDVRVTRPASEPLDLNSIGDLRIPQSPQHHISLNQIAQVVTTRTTPPLQREGGEFYTSLKVLYRSELSVEELKDKLMNDTKTGILDRILLPPGYRYSWGGMMRRMMEQQRDMTLFAVTAIVLVFLIMASQFESLLQPLIVMFTLPLAYVGSILGVWAVGIRMNEMAVIGTIILLGIVVNDGIVLVDYVNLLRRQGTDRAQAITDAVRVRIRPIFMTTLTTVGALLPLLFGMEEGADYRKPMAAVVSSGLMFATVLTLLFIPAVYSLIEDIKDIVGLLWLRVRMSSKNIYRKIRRDR